MEFLWALFQVSRPHAAGPAAFVFLAGPVVATGSLPPVKVMAGLWTIGVLSHTFACVVNDIADRDADRLNPRRKSSPLVTGRMSLTTARVLALFQLAIAVAIASITPGATSGYVLSIIFLFASVAFSNAYQKRRLLPPLAMDLLFGVNLGIPSVLATIWFTNAAIGPAVIVGAAFGVHMVLLNVIAGNLKDLEHDQTVGDATTAIEMGVKIRQGQLITTVRYRVVVIAHMAISAILLVTLTAIAPARWTLTWSLAGSVLVLQSMAGVALLHLLTGRHALSPTGREPYIVLNFLGLIVACLGFSPFGIVVVAVLSLSWTATFAAVAKLSYLQRGGTETAHVN